MQPTASDPFPKWVKAMSDEAITCPNCGYEIQEKEPVEFYNVDTESVAYIFEEIAKYIEMGRILKGGGYMGCHSVCEAWDDIAEKLFEDAEGDSDDKEMAFRLFRRYFKPESDGYYWWGDPDHNTEEEHNARIMACLFFAAMLRTDSITDDEG